MDAVKLAKEVFDIEIQALSTMRDALDHTFEKILDLVTGCKGKVVLTGMGKPGHICEKLAATFASLGTPAFFLHPAEALHGDLGMISESDVVIAMSFSGESEEIVRILPNIKLIGATLVGVTANAASTLAKHCDVLQLLPPVEEACHLQLAPTSSTTVELVYGDALAIAASRRYGFGKENYALFHPAGALGKKLLLKVADLMAVHEKNAVVGEHSHLHAAIIEMSAKQLGMVTIVDERGYIKGIITDGDLRRALNRKVDIYDLHVKDVMSASPFTIRDDALAVEALQKMKVHMVSCMPVVDAGGKAIGAVSMGIILEAGVVL